MSKEDTYRQAHKRAKAEEAERCMWAAHERAVAERRNGAGAAPDSPLDFS